MTSKTYIDINSLTPDYRQKFYQSLEDKISSLKSQLADIKYLSRDKIGLILNSHYTGRKNLAKERQIKGIMYNETDYQKDISDLTEKNITAICKLAIPNRDKIVEVLEKYMSELSGDVNCAYFNSIADEIIKAFEIINKNK